MLVQPSPEYRFLSRCGRSPNAPAPEQDQRRDDRVGVLLCRTRRRGHGGPTWQDPRGSECRTRHRARLPDLLVANLATGLVGGSLGGAALPAHLLSRKAGACACSLHRAQLRSPALGLERSAPAPKRRTRPATADMLSAIAQCGVASRTRLPTESGDRLLPLRGVKPVDERARRQDLDIPDVRLKEIAIPRHERSRGR